MNPIKPQSALKARQVLEEQNMRLKQRLAQMAKSLAGVNSSNKKELSSQIQHYKDSIAIGKKMLEKGFKEDPKGGQISFSLLQELRQQKDSLLKIKANQESALAKNRIQEQLKAKIRSLKQSHSKLKAENKLLQEHVGCSQFEVTDKKLQETFQQVQSLKLEKQRKQKTLAHLKKQLQLIHSQIHQLKRQSLL